jgi:hypothetical protein
MKLFSPLHVALLLLASTSLVSDAFLLKSFGTGGWATGFARNDFGQSLMIVGTLYTDNFWDHSFPASDTFQCMIIQSLTELEDDNTVIKSIQAPANISPQICVGGAIIANQGESGTGAVMGTSSGNAASLQILDQVTLLPGKSLDFPESSIPVASTIAANQAIYVALQSTGGLQHEKKNDPAQDLRGLVEYWKILTQPPVLNSNVDVIRYDFLTEESPISTDLRVVGDGKSVVVSSMVTKGLFLVVAGSTNGSGDAFGLNPDEGDDWDGYVTILSSINLQIDLAFRIASQSGKDDFVQDICLYGDDVYIVGTTEGNMQDADASYRGGGFVLKLNIKSKEFEYKLTIPGMEQAVKCVATMEGVYVGFYVSKTVNPSGGAIQSQDIVVTKFGHDIRDSDALWSQWLDTTESNSDDIRQDYLVGMEVLPYTGNVMILMNSMNLAEGLNDIVVLELDKETGVNDLTAGDPKPKGSEPGQGEFPSGGGDGSSDSGSGVKVRTPGGVDEQKATIWVTIAIPVFFLLSVMTYHFSSNTDGVETLSPTTQQASAEQGERTVV